VEPWSLIRTLQDQDADGIWRVGEPGDERRGERPKIAFRRHGRGDSDSGTGSGGGRRELWGTGGSQSDSARGWVVSTNGRARDDEMNLMPDQA